MSAPTPLDRRTSGRAAKSPDAFRTISEVAAELGVPQHVLRFWESKFNQIRPLKRGGGRRYYRPEDIEVLRGIHRLLHTDGYTIKGVQKLFREHGAKAIASVGETDAPRPRSDPEDSGGAADDTEASPAAAGGSAALDRSTRTELEALRAELIDLRRLIER